MKEDFGHSFLGLVMLMQRGGGRVGGEELVALKTVPNS